MADDIVARLRETFCVNRKNESPGEVIAVYERERREAAKEIKRLRRRIETLDFLASGADNANFLAAMHATRNEELVEKIDALREVLREIAESDCLDNVLDPARNKRVACEALAKEPDA